MKPKRIKMFKDGRWVKWDGSDVDKLIIKETMTLKDFKKRFPDKYKELKADL